MIDPTLYGNSTIGPVEGLTPDPAVQASVIEGTPEKPQAATTSFTGTIPAQEGAAVTKAAERERATVLASIGASMGMWTTTKIYDRITAPTFQPEEGYQPGLAIKHVPFQLTKDEYDWMKGARSTQESAYRKDYIESQRDMAQAAGDSPWASMMVGFIDPVYLTMTPLVAGTTRVLKGGRAISGLASAGFAVGADMAAQGPHSEKEMVLNALVNGAAGFYLYKPGKGMVRRDPDFPDEALHELADDFGNVTLTQRATRAMDDFGNEIEVQRNIKAEVHPALRPDTIGDPAAVVAVVDQELSKTQTIGEKLQWNMRKTMSNFGVAGKKVADILFDNNSDLSKNSVEAHRAAVRTDLTQLQMVYEDLLRETLGENGHGLWNRIFSPRKASAAQAALERDVQLEMFRREQYTRQGRTITYEGVNPRVRQMADALDNLHGRALQELKAAGVEGAEDLVQKAGWHHRKWSSAKIDEVTQRFIAAGHTPDKAHQEVVKVVSLGLRRANGWDAQLAYDVGASIVNRAMRKGYFEDSLFNMPAGEGMLKQFRDLLHEEGVTGQRLERILDVMRQNSDDAGKAGFMKHRVDIDYRASTLLKGEQISITDLIDNRMTSIVDQYLDGVSTQVAFARKGLRKASDIEALRSELLHDIRDPKARAQAEKLFDNTINHFKGLPAGQDVNENMRLMGAYGRMIALANSGLWQATEYAKMMQEYGVLKTVKYAMAEMPGFKSLMETAATDKRVSRHLKDILTFHSEQNLRLRPFMHRFEDGFEMGTNDAMHLSAQQAGQLVPYVNVMKYIHGHQARVSANLILNRLEQAANGNAKAVKALQNYGIDPRVMDKLKASFKEHGADVDKWDDQVWRAARPAFAKMMDESVLHQRLGDMPEFATFDSVGKFIFTYRSFVLTAHNKILAGGLARDGAGAVSLMMAYQFPLAAMAVQAQSAMSGKGALSEKDMAAKAFGQMGAFGMFSEAINIASGQKNQIGAPGLIPVDRAVGLMGEVASGDAKGATSAAMQMLPVLGIIQPVRGMANLIKED